MQISKLPIRQCSAVFIFTTDKRFLLAEKNRENHRWQLPQGGVEEGESHADAAQREVREELGLSLEKLTPTEIIHTYEWPSEHQAKRGFWGQAVHFFLAPLPPNQEIKYDRIHTDEPQNSKLVTLDEAEKLVTAEYFQIIKKLHAQAHQTK